MMAFRTLHPASEGVRRLMTCLDDIDPDRTRGRDVSHHEAEPEFQKLFAGYRKMINMAAREAEIFWDGAVDAEIAAGSSEKDAVAEAFDKRLAGPASDPRVVWVVRLVWLECVKRNASLPPEKRVRPEALLLQWLADAGESDIVAMLACMPYWPVGLDENGNWC